MSGRPGDTYTGTDSPTQRAAERRVQELDRALEFLRRGGSLVPGEFTPTLVCNWLREHGVMSASGTTDPWSSNRYSSEASLTARLEDQRERLRLIDEKIAELMQQ